MITHDSATKQIILSPRPVVKSARNLRQS